LARMLLQVANDCVPELRGVRVVLASQHGELSYAVAMLHQLAAGEPVSPAHFSLSVHNAPAGIWSIAREDRAASSAVCAGEDTLGQGLIEAHCQLEEDEAPVLFLYGDAPLPSEYRAFAERPDPRRVLAVLLERGAQRVATVETAPADGDSPSAGQQVDAFLQ